MSQAHFLLVTLPAQSQINPALRLAKRLLNLGARLTFAVAKSARKCMLKVPTLSGLTITEFSDGFDDGFKGDDAETYFSEIKRRASDILSQLLAQSAEQDRPVTCLMSTMPWAAALARQLDISTVRLWIQPASVLDIYYDYFKGYGELIKATYDSPSCFVELPGLPIAFTSKDLPSFLNPSSEFNFSLKSCEELIESLCGNANHRVLVNTFDSLEPEALKAVGRKLNLVSTGPLIPSAFLDGDLSDTSFGGDIFQSSKDDYYYKEWLESKPDSSVIYIAFGRISVLGKGQMEEIGQGLIEIQKPFLWVIRESQNEEEKLSCKEDLVKLGLIVPWCAQLEGF